MDRPLRLLLIENYDADVFIARELLGAHRDRMTLQVIMDGQEALDTLRRSDPRPDVILLDLNMPGLDGFGVLAHLRADPALRHLPVVVMSASSSNVDIAQAMDLGANAYLVKGFRQDVFARQLAAVVDFWRYHHSPGVPRG